MNDVAQATRAQATLAQTRLPDKETVTDYSQGVPLKTVQQVLSYWQSNYDWRKVEARINAVPNFITEIDGLDIHFIHARSKHENALPIIVTHGWPGSVVDLQAYWVWRGIGGALMFISHIVFAWNVWRMTFATSVEAPPTALRVEAAA